MSTGELAMEQVPSTQAQRRFGELLYKVQREPVGITVKGRAAAVMISQKTFELITHLLEEAEDSYWVERAERGEASGYIGVEESRKLLEEALKY